LAGHDLRLRETKTLPIGLEALHAAAFGGQLNVIGLDEFRRARHLVANARGEFSGTGTELPLAEVTAVAACGDVLAVTGIAAGDLAVVLALSADGRITWRADLPVADRYQHWPRPVYAAGLIWLFSTIRGERATVRLSQIADGRLGKSMSLAVADDSDMIDVLGDENGILIARTHADGQRLELMRVVDFNITARVDVDAAERPVAPSLARVNEAVALAWINAPSEPRLQWFDAQLRPLGAPTNLLDSSRGVTGARLLAMSEDRLAVALRGQNVAGDAGTIVNPDRTVTYREPRRTSPLWVAMYDCNARSLHPLHLVDVDATFYSGAWLGSALAIVHGRRDICLSIFDRIVGPFL
jgi:hypothetical protein